MEKVVSCHHSIVLGGEVIAQMVFRWKVWLLRLFSSEEHAGSWVGEVHPTQLKKLENLSIHW